MNIMFTEKSTFRLCLECIRCLLCIIIMPAMAHGNVSFNQYDYDVIRKGHYEYKIDAHSSNLMGDKINKTNGSISFENIDIDIPGNSELKVQLRRRVDTIFSGKQHFEKIQHHYKNSGLSAFTFDYGIVHFDTPKITMAGPESLPPRIDLKDNRDLWTKNRKHCSSKFFTDYDAYSMASDYTLMIPGDLNEKILINDSSAPGNTSKYTTKSGWKINCTKNEGFEVTSNNGIKYTFEEFYLPSEVESVSIDSHGFYGPLRVVFSIFISKIEDRFGNWVKYEYESGELKKIHSNDGREISIYKNANGATVTANGKTWHYRKHGTVVVRPDNKKWEFNWFKNENDAVPQDIDEGLSIKRYATSGNMLGREGDNFAVCERSEYSSIIEVKHPDGAIGRFVIGESLQGDTNVKFGHMWNNLKYIAARCVSSPSLVRKTIKYSKDQEYEWLYSYSNNWGRYEDNIIESTSYGYYNPTTFDMRNDMDKITIEKSIYVPSWLDRINYKTIKTTKPDGSFIIEYIDRNMLSVTYEKKIGATFFNENGKIIKEIKFDYDRVSSFGKPFIHTNYFLYSQVIKFEYNISLKKIEETFFDDNETPVAKYTKLYSDMNEYGLYKKIHEYTNIGDAERFTKYNYESDTENWVLNKVSSISLSADDNNYTEVKSTSFHPDSGEYKGLPNCEYSYGKLVQCNESYWTGNNYAGSLRKTTKGPLTAEWMVYSNYKRGIPQTIVRPEQSSQRSIYAYNVVRDDGLVSKFTDFKGNCINFDYNPVGLKTLIDYCDTRWNDINIDYYVSDGSEGLQNVHAGMLKQIVSKGNYQKETYFDYMLRPRLTKEWDSANEDDTVIYTRKSFNFDNRLVYESKPHRSSDTPYGILSEYDSLGRIKTIDDNTTDGKNEYAYLADGKIRHSDNRSNITTTSYLSYSSQSYKLVKKIASPEGVTTELKYNIFDNITQINQGGISEHLVYNSSQELCKTVRPDIGASSYGYYPDKKLHWQAAGDSVDADTETCDDSFLYTEKTEFIYNNWGKLRQINYGDSSPTKKLSYDNNGNVKTISSGKIAHIYDYNSADLLELETLRVEDKIFKTDYTYNANQALSSLKYSNDQILEFFPNALGQPTKSGNYASNAKYHPNGMIKSFKYGNGLEHKTALDTNGTGLPENISEFSNSSKAFDHTLSFDSKGNLESLTDNINSNYNIELRYDGLDRLETIVDSFKGAGYVNYDEMGNIEYYKLGNQNIDYHYDNKMRLDRTSGSYISDFTYDNRGNINSNGRGLSMTYNLAQQLINSSHNSKSLTFTYDGNDRRIMKNINGKKIYFIYSKRGKLLQRFEDDHSVNFIYLGVRPVAEIKNQSQLPARISNLILYGLHESVDYSWSAVSGASYYQIESSLNNGEWTRLHSSQKETRGRANNLLTGLYQFRARACNVYGCSTWTNSDKVSVTSTPSPVDWFYIDKDGTNDNIFYLIEWEHQDPSKVQYFKVDFGKRIPGYYKDHIEIGHLSSNGEEVIYFDEGRAIFFEYQRYDNSYHVILQTHEMPEFLQVSACNELGCSEPNRFYFN